MPKGRNLLDRVQFRRVCVSLDDKTLASLEDIGRIRAIASVSAVIRRLADEEWCSLMDEIDPDGAPHGRMGGPANDR